MKKKVFFILIALLLVLAACGVKAASTAAPPYELPAMENGASDEQAYAPLAAATPGRDLYDTGKVTASGAAIQDRLVIMNVDLSIVVADPQVKLDVISKMASDLGGFVVSMNLTQVRMQSGDTAPQGYISIRVPAEKLDTALGQIKVDTVDVPNENRSGEDVTAQYVDLQSQLKNLELAEQGLLAIMDDAKNNPGNDSTTKTQDVLNVYNQVVSVRGQIEQIKGQMKYYEESAAFSLISVTLVAEETIKPIEIGGWKPQGVARNAIQSLVKFLQGFVNFVIFLVLLVLPILIVVFGPIALIVWGIVALVRRNKKKKALAGK
ncbi:MAG: DUF4349 domain-containing protein [Chloroflexota bacterium]